MGSVDDLPRLEITSRDAWRAWLIDHHTRAEGVWLVTYKKHCGDRYVPWADLVQEALCFGWIDSRRRGVDDQRTSIMMTPRKAGSIWSAINRVHVAELEASGLMTPAGRALVDAAKADGSWTFLDDIDALIEPDDLRDALDADPAARATWDATSPSLRKQALYALKTAKRATTRQRRLQAMVARCHDGEPPV